MASPALKSSAQAHPCLGSANPVAQVPCRKIYQPRSTSLSSLIDQEPHREGRKMSRHVNFHSLLSNIHHSILVHVQSLPLPLPPSLSFLSSSMHTSIGVICPSSVGTVTLSSELHASKPDRPPPRNVAGHCRLPRQCHRLYPPLEISQVHRSQAAGP